jgi:hypothetical protein
MDAPAQDIARAVAEHAQPECTAHSGRSNRTGLPVPGATSTAYHADVLARSELPWEQALAAQTAIGSRPTATVTAPQSRLCDERDR